MPVVRQWASLSNKEQEKVAHIISALKEFNYGCERMNWVIDNAERASAIYRFYMNALYGYLARFFLVKGLNLSTAMKDLAIDDLLAPINEILDRPLGETNLRHVLGVYRDKMLAHPQFSFAPVVEAIYGKFDMDEPENQGKFEEAMNAAMQETAHLYPKVVVCFPGALDPE